MNHDLRAIAGSWLSQAKPVVMIEVVDTRGSAPRATGTRMLVGAEEIVATIGGGHLELKAIVAARAMIDRGETDARHLRFALGPSLGQCCGGTVTLRLKPLVAPSSLAGWPARLPLFHLQLHGAGHVGRAIATLLATLDVDVDWFDQRDDGFPETTTLGSPWPMHVRRTAVDTVEAEVAHAPPGAFFLILTHEHALDLRIVERVLRRGDFALCGLIGSRTKRASFERRLAERGVRPSAIARLTCPIGIEGIAGREPEVIAAAVVAQLLQVASRRSAAKALAGSDADAV